MENIKKYSINSFSSHLFWDVDKSLLDFSRSKSQIIQKVLEYGTIEDWKLLQEIYGLEEIKNVSLELRSLDVVTLTFLSNLFHIEKSEFRCFRHKQSVQNYWNS